MKYVPKGSAIFLSFSYCDHSLQLTLSVLNTTASAYFSFCFSKRFFDVYTLTSGNSLECKVQFKVFFQVLDIFTLCYMQSQHLIPALKVFKPSEIFLQARYSLRIEQDPARLEVSYQSEEGISRSQSITYEASPVIKAEVNQNPSGKVCFFYQILSYIPSRLCAIHKYLISLPLQKLRKLKCNSFQIVFECSVSIQNNFVCSFFLFIIRSFFQKKAQL